VTTPGPHPPQKKKFVSCWRLFFQKTGNLSKNISFSENCVPFWQILKKKKGLGFKPQLFETSHSFLKRHFRNLGAFSENVFEFSHVASCWVAAQDGVDFKW
jgi:hypothetical protein